MTYDEVDARLSDEARELLMQMVDLHLSATNNRHFEYLATLDGSTRLLFARGGEVGCDESTLRDLSSLGLIRQVAHRRFDVPHQAVKFAQWLRSKATPVQTVEAEVLRRLSAFDNDQTNEPSTHHLREAGSLLWSDEATQPKAIAEIGIHLRSALQLAACRIVGGNPERALDALSTYFQTDSARHELALDAWLLTTYRLTQRLAHIRDEIAKGRAASSRDELRSAVFLTTVMCAELLSFDHKSV